MVGSFVGVSAPQFVVGLLLLYVFAVQLGWLPIGGYGTWQHLVLPGGHARHPRRRLVCAHDALVDDRRAAPGLHPHRPRQGPGPRASSCSATRCPTRSCPIIAMIGIDIGMFMSGIVVVESVFGWPGIGQLAWQAIQRVDIPIIMGVTLVSAFAIVLGNLLADLIAPFIDPRIKLR